MKTFLAALTLSLFFGAGLAHATADDLAVSVDVSTWYNRFVPISRIEGLDTPHSSWAFMTGPKITARYRDLYLGVTYLLSSDDYHLVDSAIPYGTNLATVSSSASRSDVDVVFGYMLTPRLDVNAGYKGIFVDEDLRIAAVGGTYGAKRDESYNLGSLGMGFNMPLGTKTTFLLNGSALLGDFEYRIAYPAAVDFFTDTDRHFLAWGVGADTGVTYQITDNLSAGVGLKFQYIKAGTDNSNFFGPTSRIEYRF